MNLMPSNLKDKLNKLYEQEVRIVTSLQSAFILGMRLYWGWKFFRTGLGKLQNLEKTVSFFTDLGIPFPELNVYLAAGTECLGGLLLVLGLGSRIITIPLIFTMLVAYSTAHREALLHILSDFKAFTQQEPFLFLLTAVIVLLFGAGKYSLDHLIASRRTQR